MPITVKSSSFPHLDDRVSEVNPISWCEFLETRTTLLDKQNGVQWYSSVNCHSIVHHNHVHEL